jgi:DEAD/DEAH box helicase domain-containing protein
VNNPDYFFGHSPEHGYVNPDNLQILLNHLKCAAFELPLGEGEKFGALDLKLLCQHLEEVGFLHHSSEGWHWVSESYPADAVSLRSVSSDNFVIVDTTSEPRVIGEVDFSSALTTVHEKAIYIQDGTQYHVERLDYDDRKAYVHRVDSEYYTDAISYSKIKILETFDSSVARGEQERGKGENGEEGKREEAHSPFSPFPLSPSSPQCRVPNPELRIATRNHGEVRVNTQVVGFKKIKFHTNENVGSGELTLPEQEMHTTAYWLTLPYEMLEALPYSSTDRQDGVNGLGNAMRAMATLLVMCDPRDLGVAVGENAAGSQERSQQSTVNSRQTETQNAEFKVQAGQNRNPKPGARTPIFEPNIYLYDNYPGGVGFSEPLYRMNDSLLANTLHLIANCSCQAGCPSCVGPVGEVGEKGREVALAILRAVVSCR